MKYLRFKETGEVKAYESIDAQEILKHSDLYEQVEVLKQGEKIVHVTNVESEYRREAVGDEAPQPERDVTIVRGGDGKPVLAPVAGGATDDDKTKADKDKAAEDEKLDAMTVAELKDYADKNKIDLGDAVLKADIRTAVDKHRAKA